MKNKYNYILITFIVALWLIVVVMPLFKFYSNTILAEDIAQDSSLRIVNNDIFLGNICIYRFIPVNGGMQMLGVERSMNYINNNDTVKTTEYSIYRSYIHSFLLGETEVTQQLWDCVMPVDVQYLNREYNKRPVRLKSYQEWEEFIKRLELLTGRTFRIPKDNEWEFAARGGNLSKGYIFSGSNNIDEVAYYKGNTINNFVKDGVYLVANKKPNELGLFDMSGGVMEFTFSSIEEINPSTAEIWRYVINSEKNGAQLMPSRGGDYHSDANGCMIGYPAGISYKAGLRLILEH